MLNIFELQGLQKNASLQGQCYRSTAARDGLDPKVSLGLLVFLFVLLPLLFLGFRGADWHCGEGILFQTWPIGTRTGNILMQKEPIR